VTCRTASFLIVAALASPAQAGLVVSMQESDGQSTLQVEGKKLRMEKGGAHSHVVIFDGDASKFLQMNPQARTYSEMTRADGQAIAARLQEAMARMPPEQRERMEAMLGKATPARHQVKYEATGAHETVAGFGCDGYRKLRDGKLAEEGCFIPWSSGAVSKKDLAGLFELGKFMDEMLAGVPGARGGVTDQIYGELERAPGFPAVVAHVDPSGARGKEQRLLSLKRISVSSDQFAVPAGYSKVKMMVPE
jgi:hypothetical protein